ncbi:hypothetical protein GCM10010406_41140 [Streptomyces thermolineatus]|uniref:Uncharacterized protein n=1 Tax=Streptomyces thermolineatus TaxID=44033 RepID=A0ABP5ZN14_9ACTN
MPSAVGHADQLPVRGAPGLAAKATVDQGYADAVTGFRIKAIERDSEQLVLVAEDGRRLDPLDEVIVLTGFRPDLAFLSEIRLGLNERLQAPVDLAPLIDPNQHSRGTVYPHGHRELSHSEQGIYLVGMKSYGRAPTFLAMTGYEQVRSVAAAIAGDLEAADRIELTLPETGVCGDAGLFDAPTPTKLAAAAARAGRLVQHAAQVTGVPLEGSSRARRAQGNVAERASMCARHPTRAPGRGSGCISKPGRRVPL